MAAKEHIRDILDTIHLLSQKAAKKFHKKDIHRLRVEIKTLRAHLRLVSAGPQTDKQLRIPGRLKKFYRYAGEIRNIQNHFSWLRANIPHKLLPRTYMAMLRQRMQESRTMMADALPSASRFKKITHTILHRVPRKLEAETVGAFIEDKRKSIAKILGEEKTDSALHALRKILKDLEYNRKWIRPHIQRSAIPLADNSKTLLDLLGNHQDLFVHLSYLESAGQPEGEEKKLISRVQELARKNKTELHNLILQKLSGASPSLLPAEKSPAQEGPADLK